MTQPVTIASNFPPAFNVQLSQAEPGMLVMADGRVFWKGLEIKSDDDFRRVMRELVALLTGNCPKDKK